MLEALRVTDAKRVVVCRPPSPRARAPQEVARAAVDLGVDPDVIDVCETSREAVGAAMLVTPPDGQVVVAGTLYLVGAVRSILVGE